MGIVIQEVVYRNSKGDRVEVDFAETGIDYRTNSMKDLLREMISGGKLGPKIGYDKERARRMGPPPLPQEEGGTAAWGDDFGDL